MTENNRGDMDTQKIENKEVSTVCEILCECSQIITSSCRELRAARGSSTELSRNT